MEAAEDDFKGTLQTHYSKPFRLRGDWEVTVYFCNMDKMAGNVWIISNVADFSYVNEMAIQLLDVVDLSKGAKSKKPMYTRVIRKTFSTINMEFKTDYKSDTVIATNRYKVICILHFRKA